MNRKLRLAAAMALAICPVLAEATLVDIHFSLSGASVTGTGTATTDSSNLAPNALTTDFSDLVDMTMTLSGIPSSPSTTTFTIANLDAPDFSWILSVDAGGTIVDLNFFMRNDGTNADGYSMDGVAPFTLELCSGPASVSIGCDAGTRLDTLQVTVTAAVPIPGSLALLGLALGALGLRRLDARR